MYFFRVGYDTLPYYTKEELLNMYLDEGKCVEEATVLVEELHRAMNSILCLEKNRWKRYWKMEIRDTDMVEGV